MRVFIGYDPRQPVAFNVAAHSVVSRASGPVSVTRLQLNQLPIKRRGLTEFTFSRFLVPFLSDYTGISIFLDSDVLCLGDVYVLGGLCSMEHPVWVVKNPKYQYEWASMMVFRNDQCKMLTPAFVEDIANPLFPMEWATSVGEVPAKWNHLVGYDEPNADAKIIHYTQGIPCWPETKGCEYAEEWSKEARAMMSSVTFEALMGKSVHAKHVHERLRLSKRAAG